MNDRRIGRNDPCPCGSGKKYKRCHGAPDHPDGAGVAASVRIHTTPDGKAVPVIGWAPRDEDAWETIREQLALAQQHGLLVPMDNPDHWEAVGVEVRLAQTGPGTPAQWSLRTAPRPQGGPGQAAPLPTIRLSEGRSLWHREWPVSLSLAELVDWVEALQAWKSVVIAPYDPTTSDFLPFGFQIWVPAQNVVVDPPTM